MRCLLIAVLLSACSSSDPSPDAAMGLPDAAPRETVMETRLLAIGDLQEATLNGGSGDLAVITLTAPQAALDWNVHGHPSGGTVTVHEEFGVMSAQYHFLPTSKADWSMLLRNKHTDTMSVMIKIDLYGAMAWKGF
jgi:hypothetical protein